MFKRDYALSSRWFSRYRHWQRPELLYHLRLLLTFTGTTLVPYYFSQIALIIPLTLGAVAAALSDIDDRFSGRLFNLLLTLFCFALAAISVEQLYAYPWLFLSGLVLSTFLFILLGSLGRRYSVIAFGSLLIAAYTMLGHEMYHNLWIQPLFLLLGTVWYNLLALTQLLLHPIGEAQHNLAACFGQLARYFECKAAMFDPDEENDFAPQILALTHANQKVVAVLEQSKVSLFNRLKAWRGQRTTQLMLNRYFIAQEIHERASASHGRYQSLSRDFKHSDILFRFNRILMLQAKACRQLAESIKFNQPYQHDVRFTHYFLHLNEAIKQLGTHAKATVIWQHTLLHLLHNLQTIDNLLANSDNPAILRDSPVNRALFNEQLHSWQDIWQRLKANLTLQSGLFRHAVRMSIVFAVGYGIIQISQLQHGYWIILTSLFVCQPNYSTTKRRLRQRIIGTIVGVILGLVLTYLLPNLAAQLLLMIVSSWLFFLFRNSQYAYATAFITLLVFFSFGLLGESSLDVATSRLIATLIGCLIAWLAVSYLWPDWRYRNLQQQLQQLSLNNCCYLAQIATQYRTGKQDDMPFRLARRRMFQSDSELAALISSIGNEPDHNPQLAEYGFQLLLVNHTLISYISTLASHRELPLPATTVTYLDRTVTLLQQSLSPFVLKQPLYQTLYTQLQQQQMCQTATDQLVIQQLLLILETLPHYLQLLRQLTQTAPSELVDAKSLD